MQKNGFDNIKEGNEIWQIIFAVFSFHMLGLFTLEQNMHLVDRDWIRFDIIASLFMGIFLIFVKLDIRKTSKGIIGFFQKHYLKIAVAIILIVNFVGIIENTFNNMGIIKNDASSVNQNDYATLLNTYNAIIEKAKQTDTSLYRIEKIKQLTINDALNFGYNGISHSASTYSKALHEFLKKMGMKSTHVHLTYNPDTLKSVNMLLGIKYFLIPKDGNKENLEEFKLEYPEDMLKDHSRMYKAKYPLSIGYGVSKNIKNIDMNTNDIFRLQNDILKNMSNMNENVYIKHVGKITKDDSNSNEEIVYEFEVENDKDIYVYFDSNYEVSATIYCNGKTIGEYFTLTDDELIHLGKKEVGQTIKLKVKYKKKKNINDIKVYYEDEEILEKYYNELKRTQVDLKKINNTSYEGKVDIEQDGDEYVFFSIPYDEGWRVTVDGKKVEAEKVLDALIAIKVEKGEHIIKLDYILPRN